MATGLHFLYTLLGVVINWRNSDTKCISKKLTEQHTLFVFHLKRHYVDLENIHNINGEIIQNQKYLFSP